jgi:predicted transcriptional regulator
MGNLSDFQRGQFVGVCLAGASVTKTSALFGISRAAVSKVMMVYTNHGKTSSANRNSDQNPNLMKWIEEDCF